MLLLLYYFIALLGPALHSNSHRRTLEADGVVVGVHPISHGDTAYMIVCSAIVLMMTIPGLGLYYSGMVRVQNVLATVMQSFSIACTITLIWLFWGYSLVYGPAGDGSRLWLYGINPGSVHQLAPTIPESVFCVYELAFAIITTALICGSFADRMNFGPMLLFMILWHTAVYCPIAHWNWHPDGFLYQVGVMDFAGGNVVHISSGVAGFMCTIAIGNRKGIGKERFEPHNTLLTFFGCGLLWVGWYGFNAGSALGANTLAGIALLNTQLGSSMAALSWLGTEWIVRKRPSLLGLLSGAIAGLVAITPAAGYVDPTGAFFIGLISGPFCYFGAQFKHRLGFDDALDAFGIHSIGGICGGILLGFFASDQYNPKNKGIFYGGGGQQLALQLYGITVTCAWSCIVSYLILIFVDKTVGLTIANEMDEAEALDYSLHGEAMPAGEKFGDVDASIHGDYYQAPPKKVVRDEECGDLDASVHGEFYGNIAKNDGDDDDIADFYSSNKAAADDIAKNGNDASPI